MKNSIAILSLSALAAASIPNASAGDREWATVGKILTGVAAVHAISHAVHPAPVYVSAPPQVVYVPAPPPVVVAHPAPVYYAHPAPVVVYPPPVCVPAPVYYPPRFSVNIGFGHHHKHRRHCR
ncbi:MAG: hypothetical protein IPK15_04590 [Verrucomicrobia bacterium]|nr:hypothetical protein [Verrucomicrobiota bacterium]